MKKQTPILTRCVSLVLSVAFVAHALGNQFTHQGWLTDNASPATASYQMQFRLSDGPSDASAVLAIGFEFQALMRFLNACCKSSTLRKTPRRTAF